MSASAVNVGLSGTSLIFKGKYVTRAQRFWVLSVLSHCLRRAFCILLAAQCLVLYAILHRACFASPWKVTLSGRPWPTCCPA